MEELAELFDRHTSIQARGYVKAYIGKWFRVAGPLGDIKEPSYKFDDRVNVYFGSQFKSPLTIAMTFRGGWKDDVSILMRGRIINVVGKITDIEKSFMMLDDCELE